MSIQVESMPIFCLIWIAIGVIIIVISIIRLAGHEEGADYYVKTAQQNQEGHKELEELFNYFLEEEEKKNQDFRALMMDVTQKQKGINETSKVNHMVERKSELSNQEVYQDIIRRFDQGQDIEMIAKTLKKGVGEVKLILSLYNMR